MDNQQTDKTSQQDLTHRVELAKRLAGESGLLAAQRRAAVFGLVGMAIGALLGYFVFPKVVPPAVIGAGLGAIIGRWVPGREA